MKIVNLVPECRSRTDRQNREENLLSVWTRGHWTWAIVHRTRPNHRFQNLRVNLRNSTLHSCQNPKPKKEKKKNLQFNAYDKAKTKSKEKEKNGTNLECFSGDRETFGTGIWRKRKKRKNSLSPFQKSQAQRLPLP